MEEMFPARIRSVASPQPKSFNATYSTAVSSREVDLDPAPLPLPRKSTLPPRPVEEPLEVYYAPPRIFRCNSPPRNSAPVASMDTEALTLRDRPLVAASPDDEVLQRLRRIEDRLEVLAVGNKSSGRAIGNGSTTLPIRGDGKRVDGRLNDVSRISTVNYSEVNSSALEPSFEETTRARAAPSETSRLPVKATERADDRAAKLAAARWRVTSLEVCEHEASERGSIEGAESVAYEAIRKVGNQLRGIAQDEEERLLVRLRELEGRLEWHSRRLEEGEAHRANIVRELSESTSPSRASRQSDRNTLEEPRDISIRPPSSLGRLSPLRGASPTAGAPLAGSSATKSVRFNMTASQENAARETEEQVQRMLARRRYKQKLLNETLSRPL